MSIKETHHYVGFYLKNDLWEELQNLAIKNDKATVNGYIKDVLVLEIRKQKTAQADG